MNRRTSARDATGLSRGISRASSWLECSRKRETPQDKPVASLISVRSTGQARGIVATVASVTAQGLNRIDSCCSSCGEAGGEERDADDEGRHQKVDQWIGGAYRKQ